MENERRTKRDDEVLYEYNSNSKTSMHRRSCSDNKKNKKSFFLKLHESNPLYIMQKFETFVDCCSIFRHDRSAMYASLLRTIERTEPTPKK